MPVWQNDVKNTLKKLSNKYLTCTFYAKTLKKMKHQNKFKQPVVQPIVVPWNGYPFSTKPLCIVDTDGGGEGGGGGDKGQAKI